EYLADPAAQFRHGLILEPREDRKRRCWHQELNESPPDEAEIHAVSMACRVPWRKPTNGAGGDARPRPAIAGEASRRAHRSHRCWRMAFDNKLDQGRYHYENGFSIPEI